MQVPLLVKAQLLLVVLVDGHITHFCSKHGKPSLFESDFHYHYVSSILPFREMSRLFSLKKEKRVPKDSLSILP